MTDEANALVERCKGHTPGPWRWEVNRSHKSVKLCGGPSTRGFGRYDLTVMDFRRYGMNKAAPVFWNWREGPFFVGDPKRADELAVEVQGREHHANWFADIDHPDAQLVAAAPELLDLIETQAREIERLREACEKVKKSAVATAKIRLVKREREMEVCRSNMSRAKMKCRANEASILLGELRALDVAAIIGDSHDQ